MVLEPFLHDLQRPFLGGTELPLLPVRELLVREVGWVVHLVLLYEKREHVVRGRERPECSEEDMSVCLLLLWACRDKLSLDVPPALNTSGRTQLLRCQPLYERR